MKENEAFYTKPNAFDPIAPMVLRKWGTNAPITSDKFMEPVEKLEEGSVILRMFAPNTREV